MESPLDRIYGIGRKRRFELLRHFGSIEAIRRASVEAIAGLKGFNRKMAEEILTALKKQKQLEIQMNIYISGSMAYDRIMDFPGSFADYILPEKIHVLNVCFNVTSLQEKFGGTAGNIAYSLGLLGERPVIIATIGKDHGPYFSWLEQNKLSLEGIEIVPEEFTAGAYITTDKSDNQITGFNPGAMKKATRFDLGKAAPEDSVVLIAPGNLEDMIGYAAACRGKGIRYICDPGQSLTLWTGDQLRDWIRGSMMLITNDYELEVIMKMTGLKKADILGLTGMIITTLGEHGSLISGNGKGPAGACGNGHGGPRSYRGR